MSSKVSWAIRFRMGEGWGFLPPVGGWRDGWDGSVNPFKTGWSFWPDRPVDRVKKNMVGTCTESAWNGRKLINWRKISPRSLAWRNNLTHMIHGTGVYTHFWLILNILEHCIICKTFTTCTPLPSWFSWKWRRTPSFWEAHIPTFHVGSPSCHGMSFTRVGPHDPKRPWKIGQWQTCKHWPKETNISRKASAKRVGRLSFFPDLFLGSNTCRSCSKALSPPTPFCLVVMFDLSFQDVYVTALIYQQSVVGSVTFPTFWIGF